MARACARRPGQPSLRVTGANALGGAAALAAVSGDVDRGAKPCRHARRDSPAASTTTRSSPARSTSFANVLSDDGALEEAAVLYAEAVVAAERAGDDRAVASVITNLGYLALRLGDWERAAVESQRAVERTRALGDGALRRRRAWSIWASPRSTAVSRTRPRRRSPRHSHSCATSRTGSRSPTASTASPTSWPSAGSTDDALRLVARGCRNAGDDRRVPAALRARPPRARARRDPDAASARAPLRSRWRARPSRLRRRSSWRSSSRSRPSRRLRYTRRPSWPESGSRSR